MSAFDKYPLGKPAFVTDVLDRAAHLRGNDEKLLAMESRLYQPPLAQMLLAFGSQQAFP